jgi:hypothetical protein
MTSNSKSLKVIKCSNWSCIYSVLDFKNSDMAIFPWLQHLLGLDQDTVRSILNTFVASVEFIQTVIEKGVVS